MPQVRPEDADALRVAAAEFTNALAPAGAALAHEILMRFRSSTVIRNEHADESKATMRALVADLAGIPADILRKACAAYVRTPGQRFFPRASGELLAFINPMVAQRTRGAHRFAKMAEEADRIAERQRLFDNPGVNTLEETRVLSPEQRRIFVRNGWALQEHVDLIEAESAAQ